MQPEDGARTDLRREHPADGTRSGLGTPCLLADDDEREQKEALGTRFPTRRTQEAVQQKHGTFF